MSIVLAVLLSLSNASSLGEAWATAEAALEARNAEACQAAVTSAMSLGKARPDDVAGLWLLRGRCFVLGGEKKKATRAYGIGLRVQAGLGVDVKAPLPGDDNLLRASRAQLIGRTTKALTIIAEHQPRGVLLRAFDDLGAATTMAIMTDAGERLAAVAIDPNEQSKRGGGIVAQHAFAGVVRTETMVPMAVLLDKHGNWLIAASVRDLVPVGAVESTPVVTGTEPAVAPAVVPVVPVVSVVSEARPPTEVEAADAREAALIEAEIDQALAPPAASGRLAVIGAVSATAGLLGAVGFGAATALAVEQDQPVTGYVAGIVAGAALFVIGGACMLIDNLITDSALRDLPPPGAGAPPPAPPQATPPA
jgi:hypothetical protein